MKRVMSVLLMMSFVLAGISSACKFVSGQNVMEFCFSDGTVQEMPVPEELAAFMPGAQNDRQEQNKPANSDCAFCFLAAHFDKLTPNTTSYIETKRSHETLMAYKETKLRAVFGAYHSRGPPVFFS